MKSERRHELETNEFALWLDQKIEQLKPYRQAVGGTVLVLVILFFGFLFFQNQNQKKNFERWEEYTQVLERVSQSTSPDDPFKELEEMIPEWQGSSVGPVAQLTLADLQLQHGSSLLFSDRAKANQALEKAIINFEAVVNTSATSQLREKAVVGLARAYESHNELEKARDAYQRVLDQWPQGAYFTDAKQRLADLERVDTKNFYDWFAKQEPKPPLSGEPGIPGFRPSTDLDGKDPFSIDFNPHGKEGDEVPFSLTIPESSKKEDDKTEPSTDEKSSEEKSTDEKPAEEKSDSPKGDDSSEKKSDSEKE